jgi:predicted nucleic acid-binding protein
MGCAERGEIVFVASTLVIAEVTKIKDASTTAAQQSKLIREFFENPYIQVRSVDRLIAEEAQEISRKYGLQPSDSIHVATALRYKCQCLQTYDGEQGNPKKMLAFNGKIGTPALLIELPQLPAQQQSLLSGAS